MDYHTLLKQLHKGEVHEIYFFYGEEKLLQDQALKALEKQILPEGLEDFNKDIVVEECAEEFVIEHYPNPVSSILNVKVESLKGNEFTVKVFDISGRRCLEENVFIDDDKVISMDLSSLSKGMYYYSIIDDCNHVVTRTFVKE